VLDLEHELAALVDALNGDGIEYALCGGLALAVHGAPRATVDIDLLVRDEDSQRIRDVAGGLGFRIRALPMNFPRIRIDRVTKIDDDGDTLMLDLLVVSPELEDVWLGREKRQWTGRDLWLVSREGLIRLKMLRASAQDLADIERLKELE
jgi:hypothetical protein